MNTPSTQALHVHITRIHSDWIECMIWNPHAVELSVFIQGCNAANVFLGLTHDQANTACNLARSGDEHEAVSYLGREASGHKLVEREETYDALKRQTILGRVSEYAWL